MSFDIFPVLPKLFTKKFLGIDIGTSSVRIVELGKDGRNFVLSNYGQIDIDKIESETPKLLKRAVAVFSTDELAEMIRTVLSQAKIKTHQCALSIPDFSTFFTTFSLPPMTEKELPEAVLFEARQHIPLPIDSVTIDWQLVGGGSGKSEKTDITLAAIPNDIIDQYRQIANKAKLEVVLMEAEMFGLVQALVPKDDDSPLCLIDIGAQSTVCSLVERRALKYSHSFDRGANYMTEELLKRLPVKEDLANGIRDIYGLRMISLVEPEIKERIKAALHEALVPVFKEIEIMLDDYRRAAGAEVARMVLSGGAATVLEIREQFADYFKKEVQAADPFKGMEYPSRMESELKAIGPSYAVAVGMAERGFAFTERHK